MDKTTEQKKDGFGIVNTTVSSAPLGEDYIKNLFNNKSIDVEPISTTKEKESKKPQTKQTSSAEEDEDNNSFIVDEPDFLGRLGDDSKKPTVPPQEEEEEEEDNESEPDPEEKKAVKKPVQKKEPVQAEPEEEEEETEENDSPTNKHGSFAKDLLDIGFFTLDQDETEEDLSGIDSDEALVERMHHEKQKGAIQIVENIIGGDPKFQEAFNAIFINRVDPRDYYDSVFEIEDVADLDLSKVENQKSVVRYHYKKYLNWDDNKINAKIEKLENYQDLEEEAKDLHQTLIVKKQEELDERIENKKREQAAIAREEQNFQMSVQKIITDKLKTKEFDGLPMDQKTAQDLAGYLLNKKWQLQGGDRKLSDFDKDILDLDRPENRELKAKIALLMLTLKSDPTLSKLSKRAVSKESGALFSFLQREKSTAKKQGKRTSNFFDEED